MSVTVSQAQQGASSLATYSRTTLQKAPSTPANQTVQAPSESAPSTGTWRHPRFDEITRRQHASTFSDQNVRTILWNLLILLLTFTLSSIRDFTPSYVLKSLTPLHPYALYALLALRLLLATNIALALSPLYTKPDDLTDIPLTPSQRALLGLNPDSPAPSTPGSGAYITPPRYARSSTPRAGSGSPLSGREREGSPGARRSERLRERESPLGASMSGSPWSPGASGSSPLLQKAVGGGGRMLRSSVQGLGGREGSPTMGRSGGSSVPVNQKWLYEKGTGGGARGFYS